MAEDPDSSPLLRRVGPLAPQLAHFELVGVADMPCLPFPNVQPRCQLPFQQSKEGRADALQGSCLRGALKLDLTTI